MAKAMDKAPLPSLTDVERAALGLAMIGLADPDEHTRSAALRCLREWLPRLTPEDWSGFSQRQIACLYTEVRHEAVIFNPDLLFLILSALGRSAGETALAPLYSIAGSAAVTVGGKRAVAEARQAIDAIRLRLGLERDRQTLLRPAAKPDEPGLLLRPAAGGGSSDPEALLRAASTPDAQEDSEAD